MNSQENGVIRIGILGGGQLGKMLIEAFKTKLTNASDKRHVDIYVMDPNFDCPCAKMDKVKYFQGNLYNRDDIIKFAR